MATLVLHLLGTPETFLDEAPLVFSRRRSTALLSFLASQRRPLSRETVAALLTDEFETPHSSKHLSNALTELRQRLPEYISVSRQSVAFNADLPHDIDTERFEGNLERALVLGDIDTLEEAVSAYRGDFLDGFVLPGAPEFEEWQIAERERLRAALLRGLSSIASLAVERGVPERGIAAARRYLALEPWSEDVVRQLMTLEAQAGHRALALSEFQRYRDRLRDELQVEPEPLTLQRYREIRATVLQPPTNLETYSTPIVGRGTEMSQLTRLLGGDAWRIVNLVGVAGVGKTRVAVEVAARYLEGREVSTQPFADGIYLVPVGGAMGTAASNAPPAPPGTAEATSEPSEPMGDAGHPPAPSSDALAALICAYLGHHVLDPRDATRALRQALAGRAVLLVIDGADEVVDALANLRGLLASSSPAVRVLVTSRRRLELPGLYVMELRGLASPMDRHEIEASEAGSLFLREVERVAVAVPLQGEDRDAIVSLCRQLDGNPMAMIAAAEYCRGMSIGALQAAVRDDLEFLRSPASEHTPGWSIRDALDPAWAGLDIESRETLRRLTVLRDCFDYDAAGVVAGATVAQLMTLRDANLLHSPESGRYAIPALVRRYVDERGALEDDLRAEMSTRHALYYAGRVQQLTVAMLQDGAQRFEGDLGLDAQNVLAAWECVAASRQISLIYELCSSLALWYELTDCLEEGFDVLARGESALRHAIEEGEPDPLVQVVLDAVLVQEARFLVRMGATASARDKLLETARGGAKADVFERRLGIHALLRLGASAHSKGDTPEAYRHYEGALLAARENGSALLEAVSLARLGGVLRSARLLPGRSTRATLRGRIA